MIVVQGVSLFYGPVVAVDDANLEIRDGEWITLQGESGSGKTTLLRLIAGLEIPRSGRITFEGQNASLPGQIILAPHERCLGVVFQNPDLWPHLTVVQNILYGCRERNKENRQAILKYLLTHLELAGLEKRFPGEISGGQARRVALARAFAAQPRYLMMDEALVNLDPGLRRMTLDFTLARARENGCGLLYVTHDPGEAERVDGRHFIMNAGVLSQVELKV